MRRNLTIFLVLVLLLVGCAPIVGAAGKEVMSQRGEFTKVFKNDDGTTTRQYWVNPIHYLDDNSQWQEIDRTIVDLAKDSKAKNKFAKDFDKLLKAAAKEEGADVQSYSKGMTKHLYNTYFPKNLNHSIYLTYGEALLAMKPQNIQSNHREKADANAQLQSNEILYKDVWFNTDLKYAITSNGMSEYIILNNINAEKNFAFTLKGKGFELKSNANGEIVAYALKGGQKLFTIPRPIMWDANNVYCNAEYVLKEENNGYTLTLKYDERYLTAAGRAFPVTIDPDIVLARNYVDEMTYIDTNEPDKNFFSSAHMEVGNYKIWNWWLWDRYEIKRGMLRFNRLTADLGVVSDQAQVKQAKLYLDCSENKTETTYIDVYHILYDAADWDVTRVTWNSPYPSGGFYVTPDSEDTWVYIPKGESYPRTYVCYLPTDIVQTWIRTNETKNRGLMLYDYYQGNNQENLKKFNNAALEITLSEEIIIEANSSIYPNTPQTIQFNCDASSATCGAISRYEWDFDINDGVYNADSRKNPVYCYQTPGSHTYSVKAIDTNGHSRLFYGTVNVPALNVQANYGVSDPKVLRFSTNTNYNCQYTWNFGDGSANYIGTEGNHIYANEGSYNVQLTITNNLGVNPLTVRKTLNYYHPIIFVHGFTDSFACWSKQTEFLKDIVFAGDMNMVECGAADTFSALPVHSAFNFDYYRTSAAANQFMNVGEIGTDGKTILSAPGTGVYGDQYNTLTYRYSDQLAKLVEKICASTGFSKVDIVAHSMGGLVSRAYLKYYNGTNRVDKLLTLGTPNHGIGDLEEFAAVLIVKQNWQRELEVREMGYLGRTFYHVSNPFQQKSYVEFLNGDTNININSGNITGCNGNDTLGPTRYITLAGLDNGNINIPIVDLIWEWLAPDDGVIESGSVALRGINVEANLQYPGTHTSSIPGNKSYLQIITETPYVSSLVKTWMHKDQNLNTVNSKPAAWVETKKNADGTISKFVVHTGANKTNAIWTWATLQHQDEVQNSDGSTATYFTFKDYNSFWKDLSNATTNDEVLIDLSPAHYLPGETVRVVVVTYDTTGSKVEYIPVQL